jgi:hypothetical protein
MRFRHVEPADWVSFSPDPPPGLRLPPLNRPAWQEALLLGLVLWATLLFCNRPVQDPDTFWHLAVGREMWQTGHLVRTETFSFTAPGAPWVDEEWLFHTLAYPLWRFGGDTLLQLITAVCGALAAGLAYRSVRLLGGNAAAFALWFLPLIGVYSERFRFRPEIASMVFMAVLLEILLRWRRAPEGWRSRLPWLLPLFWLWIQLHGAWAYGMALLCVFLAGSLLQAGREGRLSHRLWTDALAAPALCGAVLFVNPLGWRLPLFPVRHLLSMLRHEEYVPIAEWARTPFSGAYALFSVLVILVVLAVLMFRRRFLWPEFMVVASQGALGLYWVRYAAYAILALAPSASSRLVQACRPAWANRVLLAGALAAGVLAVVLPIARPVRYPSLAQRYPSSEAEFLRVNGLCGNLFHEFRVGGYLEWVLPPSCKVFLDGRYGPFNAVGMEFYRANQSVKAFLALQERYPVDVAVYPYPGFQMPAQDQGPPRGPSALLFPENRWALVYMGDYGMVFLRRSPRFEEAIRRFEYPVLRPDDLPYLVWSAHQGSISRQSLDADLRRGLKECPAPALRREIESSLARIGAPMPETGR